MKHVVILLSCVGLAGAATAQLPTEGGVFPPFLNAFFDQNNLVRVHETVSAQKAQSYFSTPDQSLQLEVMTLPSTFDRQKRAFGKIITQVSQMISAHSGTFDTISDIDVAAAFRDPTGTPHHLFGFMTPSSIQIWDFSGEPSSQTLFSKLRPLINQQRYIEAQQAGSDTIRQWRDPIHDYASSLIQLGDLPLGVSVLKQIIHAAPFDYEVHVDFFTHTTDPAAASISARTVYQHAIERQQVEQAATYLNERHVSLQDFPVLIPGEEGLQLILVPLPPCNPWLLEDVADLFEEITGISTKVRRLKSEWEWDSPDRLSRQRDIQEMLSRNSTEPIDFVEWPKARYADELRKVGTQGGAFAEYSINQLIQTIENEPGQHSAFPHRTRFGKRLQMIKSLDFRTVYVGMTEANIYSGDKRFAFSQTGRRRARASVFSYYMMQDVLSREQLIERIAKELCPAALKQLRISPSTDPSCPSSPAKGLKQLDEKITRLSEPVKDALQKIREP
jgi:hypothetical protein